MTERTLMNDESQVHEAAGEGRVIVDRRVVESLRESARQDARRLRWFRRPLTLIIVGALLATTAFATVRTLQQPTSIVGEISSPEEGSPVEKQFRLKGTVSNLGDGYELFLLAESNDLYWPKQVEMVVNGDEWSALLYNHGIETNHRFHISLWAAPKAQGDAIRQYWDDGHAGRSDFRGLKGVRGGILLEAAEFYAK